MPADLPDGVVVVLEQVARPSASRRAAGGSRPRRSAGCRPRSRSSSARRSGTGCAPPGPQLVGGGLGVALLAGQPPGRGQHGEVVVPGHLPDLLDVAGLRLVAVVDAGRRAAGPGARRPVTGSRNQSGSALSARRAPRDTSRSRPGPGRRRRSARPRPRESPGCGQTPAAATEKGRSAQDVRRQRRRFAGPDLPAGPRLRRPTSSARWSHLGGRHPAEPPQIPAEAGRLTRSPACRSPGCCRRRASLGSSRPATPTGSAWRRRCARPRRTAPAAPLALVLPGERPVAALPLGRPHGDPLEVVQPAVPAVAGDVEGLLREARAAVGDVGDRRHRAVGEAQRGVHVAHRSPRRTPRPGSARPARSGCR